MNQSKLIRIYLLNCQDSDWTAFSRYLFYCDENQYW